jgi:hypothetical protein
MITEIQDTPFLLVVSASKAVDTKEQVPEAFVGLSNEVLVFAGTYPGC